MSFLTTHNSKLKVKKVWYLKYDICTSFVMKLAKYSQEVYKNVTTTEDGVSSYFLLNTRNAISESLSSSPSSTEIAWEFALQSIDLLINKLYGQLLWRSSKCVQEKIRPDFIPFDKVCKKETRRKESNVTPTNEIFIRGTMKKMQIITQTYQISTS